MNEILYYDPISYLWRGFNVFLCLLALFLLFRTSRAYEAEYSHRLRALSLGLKILLVAVLVGSIENMALHAPLGVRVVFTTFGAGYVILALTVHRHALTREADLEQREKRTLRKGPWDSLLKKVFRST